MHSAMSVKSETSEALERLLEHSIKYQHRKKHCGNHLYSVLKVIFLFGVLGLAGFNFYMWYKGSYVTTPNLQAEDQKMDSLTGTEKDNEASQATKHQENNLHALKLGEGQERNGTTPMTLPAKSIKTLFSEMASHKLQLGIVDNKQIQDCMSTDLKTTFPDIDYSLYGYNILNGYPMANGRDPGFTRPIFQTDFSEKKFTSDCRYSLPKGLTAAPDTSCVTSFTSTSMENSMELERTLSKAVEQSTSANVGGGGGLGPFRASAKFGVSFSSNSDFRSTQSALNSGESKVVFSEAHCNYYFTELNLLDLPQFSNEMSQWINLFSNSSELLTVREGLAYQFYDYFGTHIPQQVLYGARYTYEYKFTKSQEQKLIDKTESEKSSNSISADFSVSIGSLASASAGFSTSGSYGMSDGKKDQIKKFQESVETRTVSVGAPPPYNGDAMEWASTVKDTPVPVKVSLLPIYTLFDERSIIQQLPSGLSHAIFTTLSDYASKYCWEMRGSGRSVQCQEKALMKINLFNQTEGFSSVTNIDTETECIEECFKRKNCFLASFQAARCMIYTPKIDMKHRYIEYELETTDCKANISAYLILAKLDRPIQLKNLKIESATTTRSYYNFSKDSYYHDGVNAQCNHACSLDPSCTGYETTESQSDIDAYGWNCRTFSNSADAKHRCQSNQVGSQNLSLHYVSDVSKENSMKMWNSLAVEANGLLLKPVDSPESGTNINTSTADACFQECQSNPTCVIAVFSNSTQCHLHGSSSLLAENECKDFCDKYSYSNCTEHSHKGERKRCKAGMRFDELPMSYSFVMNNRVDAWVNVTNAGLARDSCGRRVPGTSSEDTCSRTCLTTPLCVASAFNDSDFSCYTLFADDFAQSCLQFVQGSRVHIPNFRKKLIAFEIEGLL